MTLLDTLPPAAFGVAFYGALLGAGRIWRRFRAPPVVPMPAELDEAARIMGRAFAREVAPAIAESVTATVVELFDGLKRDRDELKQLVRLLLDERRKP